ncbi:MAG: hypothetical protein KAS29_07835 [Bacteroidales bacterium]|nr:hypothetical protein [Bacteroidales bacterium]
MYQKDYILRMLEMFAQMIAGLLGLIRDGHINQASQALDAAYQDFLKNDASLFRKIPTHELTETLLREHNYTNDHLKVLSELFYAEGELQMARENYIDSLTFFEKSLILHEFVEIESRSFSLGGPSKKSLIQEKINHLKGLQSKD